jgi:hypothetical protein
MMNWLQKLAQVSGVMLYHGTSIDNARKMATEGIHAFGSDQWSSNPAVINSGTSAVYLTGTKELALRYAIGADQGLVPAILECYVSGKHMRKLRTDPMDTWEGAWDENGGGDMGPDHIEHVKDVENQVGQFLRPLGVSMPWSFLPDDIDKVDGFKLYQIVLKTIREQVQDRQMVDRIFQKFRDQFPPDSYGYYHITDDGTMRLDASYWESVHQVQYDPQQTFQKREGTLPPAVIKAVWIPSDQLPPNVRPMDQEQIASVLLPSEGKDEYDRKEQAHEWCLNQLDDLAAANGPEDSEYIGRIIQECGEITPDSSDTERDFVALATGIMQDPTQDWSEAIEAFRQEHEHHWLEEEWGNEKEGPKFDLVKVPLESLL